MNKYSNKTEFADLVPTYAFGRRLCVTRPGYIGFLPSLSYAGDYICLLYVAQVPFVLRSPQNPESHLFTSPTRRYRLRSTQNPRRYHLVWEAYVHGIMDRELSGRYVEPKAEYFEII